jgi:hypothetical protein
MALFYLCTNPIGEAEAGVIAHLYNAKWPRFLARVEKLGKSMPVSAITYRGANVVFSCGFDGELPSEYLLVIEDNIDKAGYQGIIKHLQQAVEWYMKMAAKQRSAKRFDYSLLEDYSPKTPALQVLHLSKTGEFLVSHEKGVNGFSSVDDMDEYLKVILKLSDEVIAGGNINEEGF